MGHTISDILDAIATELEKRIPDDLVGVINLKDIYPLRLLSFHLNYHKLYTITDIEKFFKENTEQDLEIKLGSSCEIAKSLITGSRAEQYGDQDKNFTLIAKMASLMTGKDLDKYDILKVMIAVKLMRERYKHKSDNLIDAIGYTDILNTLLE